MRALGITILICLLVTGVILASTYEPPPQPVAAEVIPERKVLVPVSCESRYHMVLTCPDPATMEFR